MEAFQFKSPWWQNAIISFDKSFLLTYMYIENYSSAVGGGGGGQLARLLWHSKHARRASIKNIINFVLIYNARFEMMKKFPAVANTLKYIF